MAAVCVAFYAVLIMSLSILLLFFSSGDRTASVEGFAGFLGMVSLILSSVQFIPQIVTTLETESLGALSLTTLALQSPGAALMVYSLILQPGTNWTSWISFAAAGSCQGVLLIIGIVFFLRDRRARRQRDVDAGDQRRLLQDIEEEDEGLEPPFDVERTFRAGRQKGSDEHEDQGDEEVNVNGSQVLETPRSSLKTSPATSFAESTDSEETPNLLHFPRPSSSASEAPTITPRNFKMYSIYNGDPTHKRDQAPELSSTFATTVKRIV